MMADDGASTNQPPTAIRQFINILEQLPRLCSPTICGTLSQPTTRAERVSRGGPDMFEWSLEQKAILSPANITTDVDGMSEDWQTAMTELNPLWRQQESEMFFSQKTIAPSPMVTTPAPRRVTMASFNDLMYDEEDEDNLDDGTEEEEDRQGDGEEEEDMDQEDDYDIIDDDDHDDHDDTLDNLLFSPQPLASSQSQQKMDMFSPISFVRNLEDENTLQSTPKTTGTSRARTRTDMLD